MHYSHIVFIVKVMLLAMYVRKSLNFLGIFSNQCNKERWVLMFHLMSVKLLKELVGFYNLEYGFTMYSFAIANWLIWFTLSS